MPYFDVPDLRHGTRNAQSENMAGLTRYNYEKIMQGIQDITEKLDDHFTPTGKELAERTKALNRRAGRKYAKSLGLSPNENQENFIRTVLNNKIIQEIKHKELKHSDIAGSLMASRTKITALMNGKIDGVTIDYMIRILSILGISGRINFD